MNVYTSLVRSLSLTEAVGKQKCYLCQGGQVDWEFSCLQLKLIQTMGMGCNHLVDSRNERQTSSFEYNNAMTCKPAQRVCLCTTPVQSREGYLHTESRKCPIPHDYVEKNKGTLYSASIYKVKVTRAI